MFGGTGSVEPRALVERDRTELATARFSTFFDKRRGTTTKFGLNLLRT
jgi:hypothetical protein